MKKFVLLFFCIILFSLHGKSQEGWKLLNPLPSYQTGLDIDFVSDEKGFIITEYELIQTNDGGNTWEFKQDVNRVYDMDFYNTLGFIVGLHGLVLKSTDGGDSWEEINFSFDQRLDQVQIINTDTIYIAGQYNLIKSTNGGVNWASLNFPNESVNSIFFVDGLTGHAACDDGLIFKTIDGGESWYATENNSSNLDFEQLYFYNKDMGFVGFAYSSLYKTMDGGESWSKSSGLGDPFLSMYFVNENVGYAGLEDGALYKTNDGGDSWTWASFLHARFTSSNVNSLYFFNEDSGFAIGQRGRIVKTSDGGTSWSDYALTYENIKEIDFPVSETGYVLSWNEIYKTTNSGLSWENLNAPLEDERINDIDFVDDNVGFAIVGGVPFQDKSGFVYKTTDGGNSWTPTNNGEKLANNYDLLTLNFLDENIGFASGKGIGESGLFKTTNGGDTWTKVSEVYFKKLQFFFSQTFGYAITGSKVLYKTDDGGNTWEEDNSWSETIYDFHFVDPDVGYVVGNNGLINRTENGGLDWEDINISDETFLLVDFTTRDEGFFIDDEGSVFYTDDGGLNVDKTLESNSIDVITSSPYKTFIGGSFGKILSYDRNTSSNNSKPLKKESLVNLYPNPTSGSFHLSTDKQNKIKSVSVFDVQGKLIYSEPLGNPSIETEMSLNHLPKGLYFIKVELENDLTAFKELILLND